MNQIIISFEGKNKIINSHPKDYTLGLLGLDVIQQDDKDTNWNQKMQLFSPPELCGHLKLFIDGEYDPKRLSCVRLTNVFIILF